jgi:glycosyltransferase involved in cell wall biosynthesis
MKLGIDATFLNQNHSGGKEQVLFNLLKGFQKLGYGKNIHIFAYDYSETEIKQLIPDAGITLIPRKSGFIKKTIKDSILKTFRLGKLVRQYKIDVLLFPHYNTGLKRFSIPTVVIPHDIQIKSNARQFTLKDRIIYGLQYYFDFKLRTKIIAISEFDQHEIEKYYPIYKNKIKQIYNPIDTDFIMPRHNEEIKPPYICAVNIAYIHKNTITLIKAFQKIMKVIDHNLLLIGRINAKTEFLIDYINQNKLADRVKFTGFLDNQKFGEVLGKSSLFVNPSLFEGFGMTSIEAAIRCIPVISSTEAASVEVTRNLLNYYQPVHDSEKLARKIMEVLNNKNSQDNLESIKNELISCYGHIKIARDYINFLEGLMT